MKHQWSVRLRTEDILVCAGLLIRDAFVNVRLKGTAYHTMPSRSKVISIESYRSDTHTHTHTHVQPTNCYNWTTKAIDHKASSVPISIYASRMRFPHAPC